MVTESSFTLQREKYPLMGAYLKQTREDNWDAETVDFAISMIKKDAFHAAMGSTKYGAGELEGSFESESLASVKVDLEEMNSSDPKVKGTIELFKSSLEIAKSLNEIQWYEFAKQQGVALNTEVTLSMINAKSDLCNSTVKRLESLKKGEKLLIPVSRAQHAYLLEVICVEDDNWTVKVYNTGAGCNHHKIKGFNLLNLNEGLCSHVQTFCITDIDVKNVDIDQIVDLAFEVKVKEYWYEKIPLLGEIIKEILSEISHRKFYKMLKKQCIVNGQGKRTSLKSDNSYHQFQKSGICTRKGWTLWLKENLDERSYRQYKVKAAERAIARLEEIKQIESDMGKKRSWKIKLILKINCTWLRLKFQDTDTMIKLAQKTLKRRQGKLEAISGDC